MWGRMQRGRQKSLLQQAGVAVEVKRRGGGGLKEAETGVDESERSIDTVKGVLDIGRAVSRWCNGSPA